jgi:hypothetical protein
MKPTIRIPRLLRNGVDIMLGTVPLCLRHGKERYGPQTEATFAPISLLHNGVDMILALCMRCQA